MSDDGLSGKQERVVARRNGRAMVTAAVREVRDNDSPGGTSLPGEKDDSLDVPRPNASIGNKWIAPRPPGKGSGAA